MPAARTCSWRASWSAMAVAATVSIGPGGADRHRSLAETAPVIRGGSAARVCTCTGPHRAVYQKLHCYKRAHACSAGGTPVTTGCKSGASTSGTASESCAAEAGISASWWVLLPVSANLTLSDLAALALMRAFLPRYMLAMSSWSSRMSSRALQRLNHVCGHAYPSISCGERQHMHAYWHTQPV